MMQQDPRTIIDVSRDPGLHRKPIVFSPIKAPKSGPKYSWVRDKPDARDYPYRPSATISPSSVDLRPYCSPIENQGPLGSCTSHAVAGAIEYLNKRNNKPTDVSRLFIYYYERLIEGTVNYDSGAYIRDGIKATSVYGAPLESLWPYTIVKYRVKPSKEAITDGLKRRVTLYERAADFNACINALANGFPVSVGFDVYSSFETGEVSKTGMMTYPNVSREKKLGGHAVLLVGYDNNTQKFIARNSWGTNWGDKGYFYMPYRIIQDTTMSSDFWVIKSVSNPQ